MTLKRERRGCAMVLTIDRPEAKNAIDAELTAALRDGAARASDDPAVCAVVLCSADDEVFVSGGDLRRLAALPMTGEGAQAVLALGAELEQLERCPLPVIAAVEGAAFGGGCELLLMCDLIVMGRGASLHFVHARMGLVPAWGGTTRLAERVGTGAAADILLAAQTVGAERAAATGIAQHLVERGLALAEALRLAERFGQLSRQATVAIKRSLLASRRARRGPALRAEAEAFVAAWGSAPHRAAFQALRGKPGD